MIRTGAEDTSVSPSILQKYFLFLFVVNIIDVELGELIISQTNKMLSIKTA